ncbi:hypothetical protein [Halosimplex halobium]|uniref:hypothetical protein n=1 Tax=Halosimplex halobium TaxID=3396618 RepID=UPI003F558782
MFAPEFFVLLCALLVIGYEWRTSSGGTLVGLGKRVVVLAFGWGVAFTIYQGAPRVVGTLPKWGTDATGSVGLAIGILVIWVGWRIWDWGSIVPEFALLLVGVTVPHLLITPFWDISSHVLYAMAPAGYLSLVDQRFVPLVVVALGMVVARPLAEAHTWLQSIGGLALALAFLLALSRVHSRDGMTLSRGG